MTSEHSERDAVGQHLCLDSNMLFLLNERGKRDGLNKSRNVTEFLGNKYRTNQVIESVQFNYNNSTHDKNRKTSDKRMSYEPITNLRNGDAVDKYKCCHMRQSILD